MNMRLTALIASLLLLASCSTPRVEDYAATKPTLDIRTYFNGKVEGWGLFYDMSGKVSHHFRVTMDGKWRGNVGTVHEQFTYDNGRVDRRVWQVTFTDDHHYTATATDIEGVAVGKQFGHAANTLYTLNAKRDSGGTVALHMDDWLYMVDAKTVINPITMHKYGLTVGEGIITFRKR